jgi:hypothetical protein
MTPRWVLSGVQLIVAEKPSVARDLSRVLGVQPVGQHMCGAIKVTSASSRLLCCNHGQP